MAGPVGAVQPLADPADLDRGGKAGRVHRRDGRDENQIDARLLESGEIGRLAARIGGEILRWRELLGVDKERGDDPVAPAARGMHQRQVPRMDRPHRRHQPDPFPPCAPGGDRLSERVDASCNGNVARRHR